MKLSLFLNDVKYLLRKRARKRKRNILFKPTKMYCNALESFFILSFMV